MKYPSRTVDRDSPLLDPSSVTTRDTPVRRTPLGHDDLECPGLGCSVCRSDGWGHQGVVGFLVKATRSGVGRLKRLLLGSYSSVDPLGNSPRTQRKLDSHRGRGLSHLVRHLQLTYPRSHQLQGIESVGSRVPSKVSREVSQLIPTNWDRLQSLE